MLAYFNTQRDNSIPMGSLLCPFGISPKGARHVTITFISNLFPDVTSNSACCGVWCLIMDRHNKNIVRMAIQLAMEDPTLIEGVIEKLEQSGEVEEGSLNYLLNIARKWDEINRMGSR